MRRALVWDQVCRHIDGVAVGSTVAALRARGGLDALLEGGPVEVGALARRLEANPGYLDVAMRLLADQGWVERARGVVRVTHTGRAAFALAAAYDLAVRALPVAGRVDAEALATLRSLLDEMRVEWGVDPRAVPVSVRIQVLMHLDGHIVTPVMSALALYGGLCKGAAGRFSRDVLMHQGWADGQGGLTTAGRIAVANARQYWYPMSYMRTFARVPELLFGSPPFGAVEDHVDRELDIAFSGAVFEASCRDPFLEVALPIVERERPAAVVDTGCGDGALLEALWRAVGKRPPLMVGVEPSPVARRVAAERLEAAGVPHVVVAGDIADPAGIAESLRAEGIDPADALHVSKSVIHNRPYRAVLAAANGGLPDSEASFAAPDGSAIAGRDMVANLVEHFRAWRRLTERHGMLVIEAHAARPTTTASMLGRTIGTALDSTHGYSNQYPVEPEVFLAAAAEAGLRPSVHRELGGANVLTIDHLVAA